MQRTFIWVGVIVLLVVGAFWAGNYTHDYISDFIHLGTLPTIGSCPDTAAVSTTASTTPAVNSTGSVKVLAVTPASITVQALYNQTRTFTISSATPVYTIVKPGTTGKGLSDITVGTNIFVFWNQVDPANAAWLAFPRDPSLAVSPEDSVNVVSGIITNLSASEVTIAPSSGAPVVITLTSLTAIGDTVLAGQTGRALAVGRQVAASGLSVAGGKVTAKVILQSASTQVPH